LRGCCFAPDLRYRAVMAIGARKNATVMAAKRQSLSTEIGVGAIALTPALFGITPPYNSPIHSLADLKGKKIGITTIGGPGSP
jgi:ABC-type nitrate/sulfonate/bicarbonate transport system substrate-binding protein